MIRAATDVGGTFTDFAAYDEATHTLIIAKTSTTENVVEAIVSCFEKAGILPADADYFTHGNTLAINTVIEEKGAKTGLLTTKGFRDVLEIGRGNIRNSFDIMFDSPKPLVPRELRLEVVERMLAGGRVKVAVDQRQARSAIQELFECDVESVAICLLHAYANPAHEIELKQLISSYDKGVFVTASSDLIRQYREFERTSTAVINAYVGPRTSVFFNDLKAYLMQARFSGNAMVMQSNGGTMTIDTAKAQPVRTMESGPVGGTIAAAYIGRKVGYDSVVAFDMGGTTAKVSIVRDGRVEIADGYTIGTPEMGYPIQLPVVDILEVGSGGGSIARLDETGLLKVGPVSAGANPGPVCYRRGGDQPTVTDADLVLGRLNPDFFLGGEIKLDVEGAKQAIERVVGKPLGLDIIHAASGIVRVTDADMAHAVRIMTVQKGHDPRDFVLIAYGGAGPSHAVAVARELGVRRVVIPPHPGIFSAIGMLLADAREEHVLSYVCSLPKLDPQALEAKFAENEELGIRTMMEAGFCRDDVLTSRSLEMRYVGQEFTLVIDVPQGVFGPDELRLLHRRFDDLHEARYGHAFRNVHPEIVSLRTHVVGLLAKPELSLGVSEVGASGKPINQRPVYFDELGFVSCEVYRRRDIAANSIIDGPAIIEEVMSTTVIQQGDRCRVDAIGNLVIDTAE